MRLKSKYRQEYRDGGRIEPEPSEAPGDPAAIEAALKAIDEIEPESQSEAPETPPVETSAPVEKQPEPKQDDATLALKREIERLRQSEQVRQQQQQEYVVPPSTMSREQRLAAWEAQGLSHEEVDFFKRHPEMVDYYQLTGLAVHRANEAGLERGTDAHFAAVEKIFNANLARLQAEAEQPAMPSTPTPQFFAPPPPRPAPNPASRYSAPVSRSIPNASGKRHQPAGKVTLTPTEVEAARISGITPEQYAREKLRYEGMREDGSYRDNTRGER